MSDRFRAAALPAVLSLLATLVLLAAAGCGGLPATLAQPARPSAPTASVQDQLAQLASGAQSEGAPTATAILQPTPMPAQGRASPTPARKPTRTPTATHASATDGLPTIAQSQLPKEARETIRLIQQGGLFPYNKDGSTFGNREGLLPKRPNGYYKEYTVITPGSRDRGARRIVAGQGGELYYTDDHYDSFNRVVQ